MNIKNYFLVALLAVGQLFAAKESSSSSDSCCKKQNKLLKKIDRTTVQDLVVDQTTLSIASQIDLITRADLQVDREILDIVNHLVDCSCTCTVIEPSDFMDDEGNLTVTYVITEPGSYCLGTDIGFAPVDEFTPAINILANDVRLDLRGFTLSQANDTPNAYGVQIGEGYSYNDPDNVLQNITVTNGSITNFTAIGIFCYNGSFDGGAGELAFQDLHFLSLNILDCGSSPSFDFASGIDLDSVADITLYDLDLPVAYKNVIIDNCLLNQCLGNAAVNVYTCDNLMVKDTQANDVNSDSAVFGFTAAYFIVARNLQMFDCQGNKITSLDESVVGTQIIYSTGVYLKNCQFNDCFGESGFVVGNIILSNNQNAIYENCQFNNPRGGDSAVIINGVHLSDDPLQETSSNGVKFLNCQFNGARVSPSNVISSQVTGILAFPQRNMIFESCQACNNVNEALSDAFGFGLGTNAQDPLPPFANSANITFINCVVSDIESSRQSIGYRLFTSAFNRFGEQSTLSDLVFEGCIAERIHSTTTSQRVAGIFTGLGLVVSGPFAEMFNVSIDGCRVSDVRSNPEEPSELSAGIVCEFAKRPTIINNSVSDCDRGILLTGSDSIFPSDLFQLAATEADALHLPPLFIDLTTIPAAAPAQDFGNLTRANNVVIAPSAATIDLTRDYLRPSVDLNTLGWKPGDEIFYDCNGGNPISNLVCDTTYYAIVYIPGYSQNGLIQNNEVDNCSISCYQDDAPTTLSAWVNNNAFNCGDEPTQFTNYNINFAGVRPVDAGTLTTYPVGGNKYYNLSLVP